MKNLRIAILALCTVILAGCGKSSSDEQNMAGMSEETAAQYSALIQSVKEARDLLNGMREEIADGKTLSASDIITLHSLNDQLVFDYDPSLQDSAANAQCAELQKQINYLHISVDELLCEQVKNAVISVQNIDQELLERTTNIPVYLERGDKMLYSIDMERSADIRIYNADSHQLLKSYTSKSKITDSIDIRFKAIYLIQVNPKGRQYANIEVGYQTNDIKRLERITQVKVDSVSAKKGDFLATQLQGIKMTNLFEEPRKFTLRGQLKAAFSGSYRAIVALQVPSGATDVLYSLRISTNEAGQSTDGNFYTDLETSYNRIKVLGLPLYESHHGSGLIATLLGDNMPVREEDAYINMYVFYNAAQAKKFQDGADPAKLSYNVDYSTMGTQSCNGRIPAKGNKTIYFGFLNERIRYNNYVWLEAVSAVPTTEYFKPTFTLQK